MSYPRISDALIPQRDECMSVLQAHVGNQLYAVLDLAALPIEHGWRERLKSHSAAANLFQGQPEESASERAPWLISMADLHNKHNILQRTVDAAFTSDGVSWVASALDLSALARRLARRMTVRLPEGDALLRYYDPRLFAALWDGMTPDTQVAFGAFGHRWWYLDMDLTLQGRELAGTPAPDPFEPPLRCPPNQVQALLNLSERHQLVEFLCKRMPDKCLVMDRKHRFDFVTRHEAEARAHHVNGFADRLRYCELALEHGDDFARQPHWRKVFQNMRTENMSLREATSQIISDQTVCD